MFLCSSPNVQVDEDPSDADNTELFIDKLKDLQLSNKETSKPRCTTEIVF